MWFTQDIILFSQDKKEIFRATDVVNFNYNTVSPVLDVYATNLLDLGNIPPEAIYIKQLLKLPAIRCGECACGSVHDR